VRDFVYVTVTVGFYGLMMGYVACCKRLGRRGGGEDRL
jgi:hypothetical protein